MKDCQVENWDKKVTFFYILGHIAVTKMKILIIANEGIPNSTNVTSLKTHANNHLLCLFSS